MTDEGLFRALGGRDAYEVLGVPREATRDEILRAKRERQREAHPDLHGGAGGDADSKLINNAAAILSDDRVRADYDRWSGRGSPAYPPAAPSAWDAGTPGFVAPPHAGAGVPGPFPPPAPGYPAGARPPGPPPPPAPAPPTWAGPQMPGSSVPAGPMAMPAYTPSRTGASSGPGTPAIVALIVVALLVLCCGPALCMPLLQR
ncbi:hypothetical protein J2S43_002444 [Catenuloplanes nepalensis]|uniref:J domain-containing protein n=1 Tax=Catenuloplanes nepalensis TaxID=587533 RepID=A0ABT9MR75_9ACTN|nr:DnaJ domain-containing protein [Catenuloplanes nepalensis]MDP9793932.1 hypothetical protein [Catenuloplanes nepalensis]